MGDVARCICPHDSLGALCGRHTGCAIHGYSSPKPDPNRPYALTANDRKLLRSFRITVEDSAEIQEVRQADEDRFKRE